LAQHRGKIPYCVGGDLVLASVGSARTQTALVRGVPPLMRSTRSDSWAERYSHYVYCTQAAGTDDRFGKAAAHIVHKVQDGGITRYRPLFLEVDALHKGELELRATIDRNQRAGRGEQIKVLVDGWLTVEGTTWRPNTLVRYRNPVLGVDADLLVSTVRFHFGAELAQETELVLCRPEAFKVIDYPVTKRGQEWR
jgi:prophage tail gpP-like protein